MSDMQTVPTDADVNAYIAGIEDEKRRKDAEAVCVLMKSVTKEKPVMWGPSIVGFGSIHYKYATGREGDMPVVGFSGRKQALTLYGLHYYEDNLEAVQQLGKVKTGKGCLYIKSLDDIDMAALARIIEQAWERSTEA